MTYESNVEMSRKSEKQKNEMQHQHQASEKIDAANIGSKIDSKFAFFRAI